MLSERDIQEVLPDEIVMQMKFLSRYQAYHAIHFPVNVDAYMQSVVRLKFEELFIAQWRLGLIKSQRHRYSKGVVFSA